MTFRDPGAYLRGTVTLNAAATDPAGMQSVVFERRLATGSTWTAICTDTATPFTCAFNTTGVAAGSYDLRARALDTLSHESSVAYTARTIDNTVPTPTAVDSGNGGATAGRIESGDWLRLTWSEAMAPASVLAGWDGSPLAIRVEVENVAGTDEMDFWNSDPDDAPQPRRRAGRPQAQRELRHLERVVRRDPEPAAARASRSRCGAWHLRHAGHRRGEREHLLEVDDPRDRPGRQRLDGRRPSTERTPTDRDF